MVIGEVLGAVGSCDNYEKAGYSSGGVTSIRKVYQMVESCDMVMGRRKGDWGGVTFDMKFDSHQGGVKGVKNKCQLM